MTLDGGIVIYVINRLILKINQSILIPVLMNVMKKFSVFVEEYEFIRSNFTKSDSIINNCATECYNKYFFTHSNLDVYMILK